jgi:hypothetical protein
LPYRFGATHAPVPKPVTQLLRGCSSMVEQQPSKLKFAFFIVPHSTTKIAISHCFCSPYMVQGLGTNPSGQQEGWIARLPLPVPALQVSPATGISASGNQGGPFSLPSFMYQLSTSSGSVDYAITNVPSWLDASSTSGTATTAGTAITFTVNASANSLLAGVYSPLPIVFTNTTNGQGNATRATSLTVNPPLPGALQVTPGTGVSTSGTQGGPFSPSSFSYTLASTRGTIGYSISGLPSWLDASSTSGTATTAGTAITFTVNTSANSLAPGAYDTTATFTNTTSGDGTQMRAATLTIVARVSPTATALTAAPNPSTFGQSVTFTATVTSSSGTPTGTVYFQEGATMLGSGALSGGTATFSTTTLSRASHLVTAVYGGATNFGTSTSSPVALSVDPPMFQGAVTLLSVTAACSAVTGLSVGGLAESHYRPRFTPSEPESGFILRFTGSTATLFRATGNDQMRGAGNYTGQWISDRATSTGSVPITGTYNFLIIPASITWVNSFVLITGTITNFANIAGCNIDFRGSYEREPEPN